jgi:hypothetical protein
MKKPTPAQYTAYQKIFDYFNQTLFENSLQSCMLNFAKRHGSRAFSAGRWKEKDGVATAEISLNVKQMSKGEPMEVMATLVRAMVHLWQEMHGQPSRNWYYNREWAEKMADVGLIPSVTGLPGGKETGQGVKHYIEEGGRFERAFRELPTDCLWPFQPAVFENERYTAKVMYRCVGCGVKVWGKGGLGLVCECGKVFACATGETKAGLGEKVCHLLMKQYGIKIINQKQKEVLDDQATDGLLFSVK